MNPTLYPNENGTRKPNVYQCVGGIEKLVCDHWKDAFPGKPEGLYPVSYTHLTLPTIYSV